MRVHRNVWPWPSLAPSLALSFALVGCSLVVDFPPHRLDGGVPSGKPDASRDTGAARDVGPTGHGDAQQSGACDLTSSARCAAAELCCDRQDGNGASCVATSATECSACNTACADPKAPNCGGRVCECESGSGTGCDAGELCSGTGDDARCVQCAVDADCAARNDGLSQCVDSKCVACSRGALADDASDDQGCPANKPICTNKNECAGCTSSPNNCPTGMTCNANQGCLGCRLSVAISQNGCGGTRPVCEAVTTSDGKNAQCRACMNNTECSGGYCFEASGECVASCDPDQAPGANACPQVTPICKAGQDGYSCKQCTVPADCSALTATPLCETTGTLAGQCVQCRNNTDCSATGTGATPICGIAGSCRARSADDCARLPATPKFEPTSSTCVECLPTSQAADCARTGSAGPLCTSKFTCGQCISDAQCTSPAMPTCNVMTNKCTAGCSNDTQCMNQPTAPHCDPIGGICVACTSAAQCTSAAAPLCDSTTRTCVACSTVAVGTRDTQCQTKNPLAPICITTGTSAGMCGACDVAADGTSVGCFAPLRVCDATTNTCVTCNATTEAGCTSPTASQCIPIPAPGTGTACYPCDPAKAPGMNGCTGMCLPNFTCAVLNDGGV